MVKHLVAKKVFEETLDRGLGDNAENTNTDLFRKGTVALAGDIPLQNYICRARGNWIQVEEPAVEGDRKIE